MKSIQVQLQVLTSTVQKLQKEVDSLYEADRDIARYRPNNGASMSRPDLDYEQLFNIASTRKDVQRMAAPLTYRETQVLNYVADGNTNKQIAYVLRTSDQTIKNHVSAILRKLNANDRAHAVAIAMCHGWLSVKGELEDTVAHVGAV